MCTRSESYKKFIRRNIINKLAFFATDFSSDDAAQLLILFFIGAIILAIIAVIITKTMKAKDRSKPVQTAHVRVLEKPIQQGNIEWYVLQSDSGERFKLRNMSAGNLLISVGDIGIVKYQGQTITSFQRD